MLDKFNGCEKFGSWTNRFTQQTAVEKLERRFKNGDDGKVFF